MTRHLVALAPRERGMQEPNDKAGWQAGNCRTTGGARAFPRNPFAFVTTATEA